VRELVDELAAARIGGTYNQYAAGARAVLLRERLVAYLEAGRNAPLLLVGEAPGYRGARVSGIPFTSERQLTGAGPAEASATIVHRALDELGLREEVLLWNVVPTHPGTSCSNRAPTAAEVRLGLAFVESLAAGRQVLAVGRVAARALDCPAVRHPSHGGAAAFREGLRLYARSSSVSERLSSSTSPRATTFQRSACGSAVDSTSSQSLP
jgi:uracil-DNA glycosylase family 4